MPSTTLLSLPLPATGTESGTWGATTNNGLTEYLDIAIAGMTSLTSANFTAGALTIANTSGNSTGTNIVATSAQYATIKVSSLAVNSTITAPSSNRSYRVINADTTYTLTIKASGQTGVILAPNQSALVAFNGTDYGLIGPIQTLSAMVQSKTDSYTTTLEDANKTIVLSSGAGKTFTIPASTVAYPLNTVINFVNLSASNLTIAITTDTLIFAGSGSTGSRTLAQWGEATARKIASTSWIISGVNLT